LRISPLYCVDWFRKVGIGSFIVIFFWVISGTVQFAYAENIFVDTFTIDPALNGWTEDSIQIPVPPFPATATGDIVSNDEDAVLFKIDGIGRLELSITREIDTTGFENISFNLVAFQTQFSYQVPDFIRIQYDVGEGFVTLLEDHQVWNGEHDLDGDEPLHLGNTFSTSTGDLTLPSIADDNPSLKIRLSAVMDASETNDVFFDNFDVKGDPLIIIEKSACDLLEEFFTELENIDPSDIKNPGEWVSKAANLLEMLEGADKETHALFIEKFHEYKDLLKEKLGKGKPQGSLENKKMENSLDKTELKLKMKSSKMLEETNKNNKIQTAIDLGIQKKDLIKTKNQLAVAQFLPKSAEKDKLVEQLELEKIELLKGTLILDAKHNDKKITTDFLKKLDEKITEEKEGKKSQKDQKQDDKSNNSKKSDNKSKGNSSKSKSKNK